MRKEDFIEKVTPYCDGTNMFESYEESIAIKNANEVYKLSIEYAISVLEEVANPDYQIISDGQCGVISIPQDSIYDKIKELKSLIQ